MGMRIGTWNVDARWDRRHERLVTGQVCDVWLLTETPSTLVVHAAVEGHVDAVSQRSRHIVAHGLGAASAASATT
jgi:hypothetical protein